MFSQNFEGSSLPSVWAENSTYDNMRVQFTGFGTAGLTTAGSRVLRITPGVSLSTGETHAGLVTSTESFNGVDLTLRMRTMQQLRRNSTPNTWETAWAFWHYSDNVHFYYFVLKPNGWELGKGDPAYPGAQRFLTTGSQIFDPFAWHDIHVTQNGATMTVDVDGMRITSFTDNERPYTSGNIGLYTEDADVQFDDVTARSTR